MRRTSWMSRMGFALALVTLSASAQAAILVLTESGTVLSVNTTTAAASPFASYGDVPPNSGPDEIYSPNALGYNGNSFYTTYGASPASLYRNGTLLTTNLAATTGSGIVPSIAAGDVSGSTYYYLDGDFDLYSVTNINAAPGSQLNGKVKDEMVGGNVAGQFGDLAINGGSLFVSHSNTPALQRFDLSGNLIDTYTGVARRYLGLAFDGGTLYGVAQVGSVYQLFQLGFIGLAVSETFVGQINLNGNAVMGITDAASAVPLPAAAWLLLSGLAGFAALGRRRMSTVEA